MRAVLRSQAVPEEWSCSQSMCIDHILTNNKFPGSVLWGDPLRSYLGLPEISKRWPHVEGLKASQSPHPLATAPSRRTAQAAYQLLLWGRWLTGSSKRINVTPGHLLNFDGEYALPWPYTEEWQCVHLHTCGPDSDSGRSLGYPVTTFILHKAVGLRSSVWWVVRVKSWN